MYLSLYRIQLQKETTKSYKCSKIEYLHETLGVPDFSIRIHYLFLRVKAFITPMTDPIGQRHISAAKKKL